MRVAMVNVGVMRVLMGYFLMRMGVHVGLTSVPRKIVVVLVVFIVAMAM